MKIPNPSALFLLFAGPLVLAASPSEDRKIEQAAQASYNYRTVLDDRVTAKANDGVVTLTGSVLDKDDKALAEDTVENLPGIKGVKNEILVSSTHPEHSDAWIALKIRGRLLVKSQVSAADTIVTVQEGEVTLRGMTDNFAQKELTGIYVREIEGVKEVKNNLVVKNHPTATDTLGEKVDDASITTQVKYALLRHKSTRAIKTTVTTQDGKIAITGEAGSDAEKSLVTKLARDVRGVKSVSNGMTVKS